MEGIKVNYKEAEIEYHEYVNAWFVRINESFTNKKHASLMEAKKAIDDFYAKERKFKSMEAWLRNDWGKNTFKKVKVTSISEDGTEYWISDAGHRSKVKSISLFSSSPENETIIFAVSETQKKIKELELTIKSETLKLVPIKETM